MLTNTATIFQDTALRLLNVHLSYSYEEKTKFRARVFMGFLNQSLCVSPHKFKKWYIKVFIIKSYISYHFFKTFVLFSIWRKQYNLYIQLYLIIFVDVLEVKLYAPCSFNNFNNLILKLMLLLYTGNTYTKHFLKLLLHSLP